jgi:hypothetical protein
MLIIQCLAYLKQCTGAKNLQTVLEGGITDQIRVAELITQDVSRLTFAMSCSHVRNELV